MKRILSTVFAASLLAGTVTAAHADQRDHGRDDQHGGREWHEQQQSPSHGRDYGSHYYREPARVEQRHDYRPPAYADNHSRDYRNADHHDYGREYHHDERHDYGHQYAWHGGPQPHYRVAPYAWPSGYRYYSWSHGGRLPVAFRGSSYVVYDYPQYGLYAPPYGYQWVRVGDDVLLTALATGIVVSAVNGLFY
jgi:Ni/Co efflux regulator RcnB